MQEPQSEAPIPDGLQPAGLPQFTYTAELRVRRGTSVKRNPLLIEIWITHQDGRRVCITVGAEAVCAALSAKSSIKYLVREPGFYVGTFSVTDREWSLESRKLVRALKQELGLARDRTSANVF
jgi:hypothetical protein